MAEVAGAFKALEKKIESGEHEPEPAPSDAFDSPATHLEDAFANPEPPPSLEDPFAVPDSGNAFKDPEPLNEDAPPSGKALDVEQASGSFDQLVQKLSDRNLMSRDREQLIEANANIQWQLEVKVDRVDRTFGFDEAPDAYRALDAATHVGKVVVTTR